MPAIFELRQAGLHFGSFAAISVMDMTVMEGETLILSGPNGAGKTCVLKLLAGLLAPDSGSVIRFGIETKASRRHLVHQTDSAFSARLGYCPQESSIWENLTVIEQIVLTASLYGVDRRLAVEHGAALVEEFRLAGEERTLGRELSRGNRRKLNLVLSLVHEPDILLLDEPEAELDAVSRAALVQSLQRLASSRNITMVLSTHHREEAERFASRIAVLNSGRIVACESPDKIHMQGVGGIL